MVSLFFWNFRFTLFALYCIYSDHIELLTDVVCKLLSQIKVAVMPTNIRTMILGIIVQLSSRGPSQREMSRITGESCAITYCYTVFMKTEQQGLCGHRYKTTTSWKDHIIHCVIRETRFLSVSRIMVALIRLTRPCLNIKIQIWGLLC